MSLKMSEINYVSLLLYLQQMIEQIQTQLFFAEKICILFILWLEILKLSANVKAFWQHKLF